jgi:hypothetical protein
MPGPCFCSPSNRNNKSAERASHGTSATNQRSPPGLRRREKFECGLDGDGGNVVPDTGRRRGAFDEFQRAARRLAAASTLSVRSLNVVLHSLVTVGSKVGEIGHRNRS